MSPERPLTEIMDAFAGYAIRHGHAPINRLVGCLEVQVDSRWWIAANGHRTPTKCSKGVEVAPFEIYIEFNGWPAGMVSPFDGVLAAGSIANEAALVKVLREA
jgi:hypothetical protein